MWKRMVTKNVEKQKTGNALASNIFSFGYIFDGDKKISLDSEYGAKLFRKRELEIIILEWRPLNEVHEELQALNKWLEEHAKD